MDKAMNIMLALVVLVTLAIGAQAFHQLNDGRVLTVVQQLTTPQLATAQASTIQKRVQ